MHTITVRARRDILAAMWEKFAFIASTAVLTCLIGEEIGPIARADNGTALARRVLDEVASVATAEGFPLACSVRATLEATLTDPSSTLGPSMYRDMAALRPHRDHGAQRSRRPRSPSSPQHAPARRVDSSDRCPQPPSFHRIPHSVAREAPRTVPRPSSTRTRQANLAVDPGGAAIALAAQGADAARAVGPVGDLDTVRARLVEYSAAGLDEVAILPATTGDPAGERTPWPRDGLGRD